MLPVLHDIDLDKCLHQIRPDRLPNESFSGHFFRTRTFREEAIMNLFKDRADAWWRYSTHKNLHIICEDPREFDNRYDDPHFTGVLFYNNKSHHWAEPLWTNCATGVQKFFPTSAWIQIFNCRDECFIWYDNRRRHFLYW
jgi:hypothetical protein